MTISSPGIGSGLDVNSIVSKLMAVESAPLTNFDTQTASYQAKVSALGSLSGALSTFQGALSGLTSVNSFQALTATPGDPSILSGTATSTAQPGTYRVNVTQLAQSQTLSSAGYKSTTAAIGVGATTTVNFTLGSVTGGSFGVTGSQLGTGLLNAGLTPGGLTIDGTTIATDGSTRSARALADAINAKSDSTGVSATAAATVTDANLFGSGGTSSFGNVDTSGGGSYTLSVGGVDIAVQGAGVAAGSGVTAASIDSALASTSIARALSNANITVSGSAAAGTLQFTDSDGNNIDVEESVSGSVTGGISNSGQANLGSDTTAISSISLSSANASQITVGGSTPASAGLTAGTGGAYIGASFSQNPDSTSGSVVINSSNNSLQGIANAINTGNFGVTASIVSDGSATTPNHLVLTSTATGASSSIQISLQGDSQGNPADPALVSLLSYDPTGTQNLTQEASAQDTQASVNGIPVSSSSTSITGAVAGVSFNLNQTGSTTLVVAQNSSSLSGSISGFVSAYNALQSQISSLASYDASTSTAGPLLGDSNVQELQSTLRKTLSQTLTGLQSTSLTSLSQIGISFQDDGTLSVDNGKLQTAITSNFNDIAGLFAAVGRGSDAQITYTSSTSSTQPGDYAVDITTLASQGTLTSAAPLPASITIADGTSWTVHLNDDGTDGANSTATISPPAGTYTPAQLASLLQSSINGVSAFSSEGATVSATVNDDGTLKLNSTIYGSTSNISLVDQDGTSISTIFGNATTVDGVDVAGTIGGYSATGSGQSLTGAAGAPTAGLKLLVQGDTTGARGTVGFSQGYAYQLNNLASNYLGSSGYIAGETNGLNSSIADVASQVSDFKQRLTQIQANYEAQYTALDTTVSSLNTTASFLTQQFAAMAKQ